MKLSGSLAALLVTALLFGCAKKREISGQVFVSSEAGISYKLGAVPVCVYPADLVRAHIDVYIKKSTEIEHEESEKRWPLVEALTAIELKLARNIASGAPIDQTATRDEATMNELSGQIDKMEHTCNRRMDETREEMLSMGGPASPTSTDADGAFRLVLEPAGEYYLVTRASRSIGQDTERYYWIVKIGDGPKQQVYLNNLNVIRYRSASRSGNDDERKSLKAAIRP